MQNPKTTGMGIAAILAGLSQIAAAMTSEAGLDTVVLSTALTGILSGIGMILAKDGRA